MRGGSFLAVLLIVIGIVLIVAGSRGRAPQLIELLRHK